MWQAYTERGVDLGRLFHFLDNDGSGELDFRPSAAAALTSPVCSPLSLSACEIPWEFVNAVRRAKCARIQASGSRSSSRRIMMGGRECTHTCR